MSAYGPLFERIGQTPRIPLNWRPWRLCSTQVEDTECTPRGDRGVPERSEVAQVGIA